MLHAPKACVHECMCAWGAGPVWPMFLAKPADSQHESMHATRYIYKLLIPINISTRSMNLTICAPREACARQPCGGPDMLARICMHAWTCLMAQIIHICMRQLVPGAGAGPACMGRAVHARGKCQNLAFQHLCALMPHACGIKACYCMFISTHMGILSSPKRPHEACAWHAACDSTRGRPNHQI